MSPILRTISAITVFFLLFLAAALLPTSLLAQETIRIGGTGTGLGTMTLLASAFQKKHPEIKIRIMPSIGSSGAIQATAQGALDIGLNGRPLTEREAKLGLVVTEYAKTPFVFAVRKDVPVQGLTSKELVKIYSGEMTGMAEWRMGAGGAAPGVRCRYDHRPGHLSGNEHCPWPCALPRGNAYGSNKPGEQ